MPANDVSGYNYKGYYRDIKPSNTDWLFYTLPQGITIIEEEFFVSYSGFFNSGLVQIQSLYDPAYYGNSGM